MHIVFLFFKYRLSSMKLNQLFQTLPPAAAPNPFKTVHLSLSKCSVGLLIRTEDRPSICFQNLIESLQHEVLEYFALEFQFDFEAVFLDFVPVVGTEGEFPFEHVDDLVLVLLVDALQVLLVVHDVLLVDDAAPQTHGLVELPQALAEDDFEVERGEGSGEEDYFLPGEGEALFSAGPELLEEEDDGFEDAAVEDGDCLSSHKGLLVLPHSLGVKFGREEVLPINEGLV
jgi:hypothetical protein